MIPRRFYKVADHMIETGAWEYAITMLEREHPDIEVQIDFKNGVPYAESLAQALFMFWRCKQKENQTSVLDLSIYDLGPADCELTD